MGSFVSSLKLVEMKEQAKEDLYVNVSLHKCKKVREIMKSVVENDYLEEHNFIPKYVEELRRTNLRSKFFFFLQV